MDLDRLHIWLQSQVRHLVDRFNRERKHATSRVCLYLVVNQFPVKNNFTILGVGGGGDIHIFVIRPTNFFWNQPQLSL